jgi:flavin reductase (DIM6/NTAB) family NADH-FMN oxidoreductase RutF
MSTAAAAGNGAPPPGVSRAAAPDAGLFRQAMGHLVSGVAVVSTAAARRPDGMTVSSLISVSLDPPLLLVSLASGARTTGAVAAAGRFAVSLLSAGQEMIARRFAASGTDHFGDLPVTYGEHDVPIVPNALVHLECTVERTMEAGDHVLVIGKVCRICQRDGEALAFHGGLFGDFADRGHEPVLWAF